MDNITTTDYDMLTPIDRIASMSLSLPSVNPAKYIYVSFGLFPNIWMQKVQEGNVAPKSKS